MTAESKAIGIRAAGATPPTRAAKTRGPSRAKARRETAADVFLRGLNLSGVPAFGSPEALAQWEARRREKAEMIAKLW